ncbi:MAG: acyl-CoA dehydrogenase family protein [Myxococcales bacterium]|nr:acyl-CoA dehydrogenase family protein [Myxococcales bacterium]
MYLDYTPEQHALRTHLRQYFDGLMSEALLAELDATEGGGPLYHETLQRLGADGWLGIGWPKEHGGQGRGPIEQFIFFDEAQRAGFPVPILTLNTVGPTLLKYGTDAQKRTYPPRILEGRCHFSIGYTEPGSGTDLASLRTTAVREGDHYVVNGQKIWTSLADHADYLWLACRTNLDPSAPPHRAISILIVPTDAEGLSITPMHALGENNVHACYFDQVRVPADNLVGREHGGWQLITSQLNHERVALCAVGPLRRILDETIAWAKDAPDGQGGVVFDTPWVRANLARVYAKLDVLELLNTRQAFHIAADTLTPAEASAIKVYGSELYVACSRLLMEVHGEPGTLHHSSAGAMLRGRLEKFYRMSLVLTFGGGTNEVQRDLICQFGLRMPRGGR